MLLYDKFRVFFIKDNLLKDLGNFKFCVKNLDWLGRKWKLNFIVRLYELDGNEFI